MASSGGVLRRRAPDWCQEVIAMALWKARGGSSVPSLLTVVDTPTPHHAQRVLVTSFSGFMDAGSAAQIAVTHLLKVCSARTLATFDSDALIDYRARRPKMIFNGQKFVSSDWPQITLQEVLDERGTPFLLLSGPEPDYRWREFVSAVLWLVEELDVSLTVGMIGIPWPAPHTRPVGVTLHGTHARLLRGHRPMLTTMEIPGHAQAIVELSLGEAGRDAMGLAVHVPHYLTQFEYPRAAIALLRSLSGATGLELPTDGLEEQAVDAEAEIARQTSDSSEFEPLLRSMEEAYDRGESGGLLNDDQYVEDLPDADQIGAQVERFLAEMDDRGPDQSS
jgi:predicted ATP-grasp superfamily ATP-dependent carboligase